MKYQYTLRPPESKVCVLTSDMEKIAIATKGQAFANTVTSETLLSPEDLFTLQRSVETGAKLDVRSLETVTANYWLMLAQEYPQSSIQDLQNLGF